MSLSVVRARRGFWVVLDRENRVFPVLDAFDRAVIEVQVGDLERLGARNAAGLTPHCKAVVL